MKIAYDVAQKQGLHDLKHSMLEDMGHELIRLPLPVADYIIVNDAVQDVIDRKAKRKIPVKKMDLLGTYHVAVDTKASIQECVENICGKSHARFRDECILAQNNGIKLYIVVEDDGGYADKAHHIWNKPVRSIDDLFQWVNPRLCIFKKGKQAYPSATRGQTLAKACITMTERYGVEFLFCKPNEAASKIVKLLNEGV